MSTIEDAINNFSGSITELAKAMLTIAEKYEALIDRLDAAQGGTAAAAAPAEKGKGGRPTKAEAAAKAAAAEKAKADADDGFGDDEEEEEESALTAAQVKEVLLAVAKKDGDKKRALALVKKFGYDGIPDIEAKDFKAIHAEATKML